MAIPTVKAWYGNAASNSFHNQLIKFHQFLTSGLNFHTVVGASLTSPYTNFNHPWVLIGNSNAGYRVFIYADSSAGWRVLLDPSGGLQVPSGTTDTPLSYGLAAPSIAAALGFKNVHQTFVSNYGTLIHAAEYPDALLFAVKHTTNEYWASGLHTGKIYIPFNASDPAIGIDGYGVMCSQPSVDSTNVTGWCGYGSDNQSRFRVGTAGSASSWIRCVNSNHNPADPNPSVAADLNGQVRMIPYFLRQAEEDSTSKSYIGYTKYVRAYKASGGHGAVIPASDSSDQAWFRYAHGTGSGGYSSTVLWSKTPVNGDV